MHFTLPTAILLAVSALEAAALPNAAAAVDKPDYYPGWCTFHVTQWQKNKGTGDLSQYRLDISLSDAGHNPIGHVKNADALPDAPVVVKSRLPDDLEATVGFVDKDPIRFHYGGQHWESSTGQCKFGGYQNGNRDGDCGFTC